MNARAGGKKRTSLSPHQFRRKLVDFLPRLRPFALSLTGNSQKADDLLQETMERALQRSNQFSKGTRMDHWLFRIVYTRWIDSLRKSRRRTVALREIQRDRIKGGNDFQKNSINSGIKLDLKRSLARLSSEHKAALTLVTLAGFSYSEAAEILDLPVGTVASRVARARSQMVDLLTSEDIVQQDKK